MSSKIFGNLYSPTALTRIGERYPTANTQTQRQHRHKTKLFCWSATKSMTDGLHNSALLTALLFLFFVDPFKAQDDLIPHTVTMMHQPYIVTLLLYLMCTEQFHSIVNELLLLLSKFQSHSNEFSVLDRRKRNNPHQIFPNFSMYLSVRLSIYLSVYLSI